MVEQVGTRFYLVEPAVEPAVEPGRTRYNLTLSLSVPVGKPIPVTRSACPTSEDIDGLHSVYLQNLVDLFEQNKNLYGLEEHQHLTFIWPGSGTRNTWAIVISWLCSCSLIGWISSETLTAENWTAEGFHHQNQTGSDPLVLLCSAVMSLSGQQLLQSSEPNRVCPAQKSISRTSVRPVSMNFWWFRHRIINHINQNQNGSACSVWFCFIRESDRVERGRI